MSERLKELPDFDELDLVAAGERHNGREEERH